MKPVTVYARLFTVNKVIALYQTEKTVMTEESRCTSIKYDTGILSYLYYQFT